MTTLWRGGGPSPRRENGHAPREIRKNEEHRQKSEGVILDPERDSKQEPGCRVPQPAGWSGTGFKTRCRRCGEETREHEKHQERLCLCRSPITLPDVPSRVDENGNRCRPRSDVALGKPKNEIRDA